MASCTAIPIKLTPWRSFLVATWIKNECSSLCCSFPICHDEPSLQGSTHGFKTPNV